MTCRQAGAPLIASILLVLSVMAAFHAPPIGPIGLLLLAGAVVVLSRVRPLPGGIQPRAKLQPQ